MSTKQEKIDCIVHSIEMLKKRKETYLEIHRSGIADKTRALKEIDSAIKLGRNCLKEMGITYEAP